MTKPHLSASSIDTYLSCGVRWEFAYVKNIKAPPGIALIRGTAGHHAAAHNFRQKIETHEDLPAKELVEVAAAKFEEATKEEITLSLEEQSIGRANVLGDAKDDLVDVVTTWRQKSAPNYQPVPEGVEAGFRIELPAPRDFVGYIDLIHTGGIVDFKFRGRRGKKGEARQSLQLVGYAAAYKGLTGEYPAEVAIDTIAASTTSVSRSVDVATVEDRDVEQLAATINAVQKGIDAGVFLPAQPGSWQCSSKFCGYARMCPFFRGDNE